MNKLRINPIAALLGLLCCAVFAAQCAWPQLTRLIALPSADAPAWVYALSLFAHGNWLHVITNALVLVVFLHGMPVRESIVSLAAALPAAVLSVVVYHAFWMPDHAVFGGLSAWIFAVVGLVAWRDRKSHLFSLFCVRRLSLPPVQMLGAVLLADAAIAAIWLPVIAWQVHSVAALAGLLTGTADVYFRSVRPLFRPRWALALLFVTAGAVVFLSTGCVGNKAEATGLKIERSRKSTTAENIEAGGKVAAGAWDRLTGKKN